MLRCPPYFPVDRQVFYTLLLHRAYLTSFSWICLHRSSENVTVGTVGTEVTDGMDTYENVTSGTVGTLGTEVMDWMDTYENVTNGTVGTLGTEVMDRMDTYENVMDGTVGTLGTEVMD